MTLTDALEKYVLQLRADGRSSHTVAQKERHVRLLATWLVASRIGDDLAAVDHEAVARFLVSPTARLRPDGSPNRATSVNCLRSSIRSFFRFTHEAGLTAENAARLVRSARCASGPPRALAAGDQERLFTSIAADPSREARRDEVLFRLMLGTGVRLGSALGIERSDVDLSAGEIRLRTTKGDRPATALVPAALGPRLAEHVEGRTDGPIFTTRHGGRLGARQARRRLAMWMDRAGVRRRVGPHGLRHAFALGLYERTRDVLLVREALHHASIASTMVYARASAGQLRAAIG